MKKGEQNNLEKKYEQVLLLRKAAGEIVWYKFQGMKFDLGPKCFYTPDFNVMLASGELQMHETKGFWLDDSRAKIKIASEMFPVRFIGVKLVKNNWVYEDF